MRRTPTLFVRRVSLFTAVALLFSHVPVAFAEPKENQELPPVYFYSGSAELDDEGKERCAKVAEYLKQHPKVQVHLRGGTDPIGSVALNRRLGKRRALSARKALLGHGVPRHRINVVPPHLASSGSPEDPRFLRYVKFLFTGPTTVADVSHPPVPKVTPTPSTGPKAPTGTKATATAGTRSTSPAGVKLASAAVKAPSQPTGTQESVTPDGKPKLEKIRLLFWRAPNHMLWALAKAKGYFRDEGFDAQLVETQQGADKIARVVGSDWKLRTTGRQIEGTAPLSQRFFAGGVCAYGFEDAVAKKRPLVQIGTLITLVDAYLMKKELADAVRRDLKALRGKTIAIARWAARPGGDPLFISKLAAAGLHINKDYKMKLYPENATHVMYEDLAKGVVDLAWATAPLDLAFTRKHPEFTRVTMASLLPYMPCCRQLVPREALRKNRQKYVRFQRAVIRAERLFVERPREAMKIIANYLKLPVSAVREIYSGAVTMIGDPNLKGSVALDRTYNRGPRKGGLGEFVDGSVYEDALLSLAKEEPNNAFYKSAIRRFKRNN